MKRFYPTAILRVIGHTGSRALHPVTTPAAQHVRDDALHHRIALTPRRIAHDTFDVAAELDNPRTVEPTCLITR
jgi:hypothetical protein